MIICDDLVIFNDIKMTTMKYDNKKEYQTRTIAVAMSGGIDSTVAALLLKEKYENIFGIHFITGYEPWASGSAPCNNLTDTARQRMQELSGLLEIPIHVTDGREVFKKMVVERFAGSYLAGNTPNPCIICNKEIKFSWLFDRAKNLGADLIATGHYAGTDFKDGRFYIVRGKDPAKEQSYFLGMLSQDQIKKAIFPLSALTKQEVKKIAKARGINPVQNKESQDICFIGERGYADFIEHTCSVSPRKGPIVDLAGNRIGTHNGLHNYTIGQRRGIGCPDQSPFYVIGIDPKQNRLIVGKKEDLYGSSLLMTGVNWSMHYTEIPFEAHVKIRYRSPAARARLVPLDKDRVICRFFKPQKAITPGQAAVCYVDDRIVCAGWITRTNASFL